MRRKPRSALGCRAAIRPAPAARCCIIATSPRPSSASAAAAAARLTITADRVKAELAAIAFANIADVADWGPDGVTLKDKKTLAKADQAAIAEPSTARVEKTGAVRAHVKMHSKQHALDALAKQLGIYGRGSKTIARAAGDAGEKRDANTILRERLLKIAARGKP
jgi:hypothetical protein